MNAPEPRRGLLSPFSTNYPRRLYVCAVVLMLVMFNGCTVRKESVLPPITANPTDTFHVGKFVWFDLLTNDVSAVQPFYGELFGWRFQQRSEDVQPYTVITHQGKPIAGVVYDERSDLKVSESRWIASLSVEDVDQAVEVVQANGGVVHERPQNFPERGRLAVVSDPQGAMLALLRANGGDPPDTDPTPGGWLWNELWTDNEEEAVSFYQSLVGYEHQSAEASDDLTYSLLKRDGVARASVIEIPWENIAPNWVPYVLVENIDDTVAQTKASGGQVMLAPQKNLGAGRVAIIADPSGAALIVEQLANKAKAKSGNTR